MPTESSLMAAFVREGLIAGDVRTQLPRHATKFFATRAVAGIRGIVVHHTAANGGDLAKLHAIARYHVGPNHVDATGSPGILYTLAVGLGGEVYLCNDLAARTTSHGDAQHPGDENADYLACLVMGDFRGPANELGGEPTLRQIQSLLRVYDVCKTQWGWSSGLYGHFDFGKASCPGTTLEGLIRALRRGTAAYDLDTHVGRQRALKSLGFDAGPEDGIWGIRSRAALTKFQRSAAVEVDGVWGPETRAAMELALAGR